MQFGSFCPTQMKYSHAMTHSECRDHSSYPLLNSRNTQNNTYRASQNQIWCLVQPQLSIFPAPSSILATLLPLQLQHTGSSENTRGRHSGQRRGRRPQGALTVLLMLANSFPLNSTMEYTAPFTSFSATVCSFPEEKRHPSVSFTSPHFNKSEESCASLPALIPAPQTPHFKAENIESIYTGVNHL